MRIDGNTLVFSTGTRVPAAQGLIGITSDGEIYTADRVTEEDVKIELTDAERMELAEVMIVRWAEFYAEAKK